MPVRACKATHNSIMLRCHLFADKTGGIYRVARNITSCCQTGLFLAILQQRISLTVGDKRKEQQHHEKKIDKTE